MKWRKTKRNDFVSMPNDEINRYMKMEKLLENKISRRFKVRRLEIHDFGYLMLLASWAEREGKE